LTEIPEHLLKRSRDAKAAASGEAASTEVVEADEAAPSAVAPATTSAAVEEVEAAPEPPARVADYVQAAHRRKKMPFWIVPVLLTLPVWAAMYALERVPQGLTGLLGEGEVLYIESGCAGCHGVGGGGGIGPALADGEVYVSFTSIEDQIVWIAKGSTMVGTGNAYTSADSTRPRSVSGQMPGFGSEATNSLSVEEIIAVTLYVRTQFERDLVLAEQLSLMLETGELKELLSEDGIDFLGEFEAAELTAEDVARWLAPARAVLAEAEG